MKTKYTNIRDRLIGFSEAGNSHLPCHYQLSLDIWHIPLLLLELHNQKVIFIRRPETGVWSNQFDLNKPWEKFLYILDMQNAGPGASSQKLMSSQKSIIVALVIEEK